MEKNIKKCVNCQKKIESDLIFPLCEDCNLLFLNEFQQHGHILFGNQKEKQNIKLN